MSYKFAPSETVPEAIARCAREQLDRAARELREGIDEDPVRAVHRARKSIKKGRSLLRLARGAMPAQQRRRENDALREAARELSGARDREVMIATLEQLSDRFAGQLPAATFEAIRQELESVPNGESVGPLRSASERAVQALGAVRGRVEDWSLSGAGWKSIDRGLLRTYKRGRKAFARARASGSLEDLHAWRRRVKDLWYHERLLAPTCGPAVRGHAKDAHRLADLLGDDHDLGLLRQKLNDGPVAVPVDLDAVIALLDHRRSELQLEAMHIGGRLYAESPKAFRRRMRRSWTAGREAATERLERHPAELAAATREPRAA